MTRNRALAILLLISPVLLPGCSTTNVHVFTDGFEESQLAALVNKLDASDHKYRLNSLPVPRAIAGPTILYSPVNSNPSRIDDIVKIMSELGYERVSVEPVERGNHLYTADNIGIYPISYTATHAARQQAGLHEIPFFPACPKTDGSLSFEDDGTFEAVLLTWESDEDPIQESVLKGTWTSRKAGSQDQVILQSDTAGTVFSVERYKQQMSNGDPLERVELSNQTPGGPFGQCSFSGMLSRGEI